MLGYALLGAGWIVLKTEGALRDWAYARIPWLVAGVFVVLGLAFIVSLTIDAAPSHRAISRRVLGGCAFPHLAVARPARRSGRRAGAARRCSVSDDCAVLSRGLPDARRDVLALYDPYSLTVADAAAPDVSLRFFFYGGIVVLPVIFAYTIGVYYIFRGKAHPQGYR